MHRILVTTFAVVVFSGLPLLADNNAKDDADSDHKLIQGKWKLVERHRDGKVQKKFDLERAIQITKDAIVGNFRDREFIHPYKVDVTKKPKHMDRTVKRNGQSRTWKLIYSLKGNTLKICAKRSVRGGCPTKFESKEGDGQVLMVFKRDKEEDK